MKPLRLRSIASLIALSLFVTSIDAAPPKKVVPAPPPAYTLTVDFVMRGPNLYGYEPRAIRWSGDSSKIYFEWKQWNDAVLADFDTYVVNRDGSGLRKLSEQEARLAPPENGDATRDHQRTVYARDGDIYLYDAAAGSTRPLTRTVEPETSPRWLSDEKHVSFVRANNLYVLSLEDGALEQMTDVRTGPKVDEDKKGTESQEFVKKEEAELLAVIKDKADKKKADKEKKDRENPRKPFYLTGRQQMVAMQVTPDRRYVLGLLTEPGDGALNAAVPNYVTLSGYTEDIPSRNKVGDKQSRNRLVRIDAATGEIKPIEAELPGFEKLGPLVKDETKADGKKGPNLQNEAKTEEVKNGEPKPEPRRKDDAKAETLRSLQWQAPSFNEAGDRAVVWGRAADNKDAWLLKVDVAGAKATPVANLHDEAWVQGPGISFGFGRGTFGWLADGHSVYYQSEASGYSQLYATDVDTAQSRALTEGKFEIHRAELSRDKKTFYLVTSEVHPGEQQVYSMAATGGPRTRLTAGTGKHDFELSPDEKWIADVHSYMNKPPELYVMANGANAVLKPLTDSPSPDFKSHTWVEPQLLTFKARDGADVYARLYKPAHHSGGRAVVFVHGAGYLQNAHRWWSQYSREYLFHHLLMERGYLVLDLDYRGSAGYGRDWRTGIYRFMGGKDLDDEIDGAKWLVATQGVDAKKIGIYGGSYGGFMTLMALFTQPDVFAAGAALRPVTDWAHYNHPYTSNILNQPQKDAEAYRKSSPIYFAQNLKSALLICHGMVDTNVHFQDSVRLVERLIELRKENWELAVFPVEDHGFIQPTSWADEYKRILKLFDNNLK